MSFTCLQGGCKTRAGADIRDSDCFKSVWLGYSQENWDKEPDRLVTDWCGVTNDSVNQYHGWCVTAVFCILSGPSLSAPQTQRSPSTHRPTRLLCGTSHLGERLWQEGLCQWNLQPTDPASLPRTKKEYKPTCRIPFQSISSLMNCLNEASINLN